MFHPPSHRKSRSSLQRRVRRRRMPRWSRKRQQQQLQQNKRVNPKKKWFSKRKKPKHPQNNLSRVYFPKRRSNTRNKQKSWSRPKKSKRKWTRMILLKPLRRLLVQIRRWISSRKLERLWERPRSDDITI
jgi:hypothetical protein